MAVFTIYEGNIDDTITVEHAEWNKALELLAERVYNEWQEVYQGFDVTTCTLGADNEGDTPVDIDTTLDFLRAYMNITGTPVW